MSSCNFPFWIEQLWFRAAGSFRPAECHHVIRQVVRGGIVERAPEPDALPGTGSLRPGEIDRWIEDPLGINSPGYNKALAFIAKSYIIKLYKSSADTISFQKP